MSVRVLVLLGVLVLFGCTAQVSSPEQRQQQTQAIREYTARVGRVTAGMTKADVQSIVGTATTRSIFREGPAEVEEWWYPTEIGYAQLRFLGGVLSQQKTQRTTLHFARDTSIPLTEDDIRVHLALSTVKLGTSKSEISAFKLKPTTTLTEQQTAEVMVKVREAFTSMKDSPLLLGIDLSGMNRDIRGEMWIYTASRLQANLFFVNDQVDRISFSEQPTKAQLNEIMQKAL